MKTSNSPRRRPQQQFATRCKLLAAALSVAAGISASAEGGTDTWIAGGGAWSTPGDWSPTGVPANGDNVLIDPNASLTITFDGNYTGSGLNSLTLDDSNGTATLSQSSNSLIVSGGEAIGVDGNGTFTQDGGTSSAGTLYLGYYSSSTGNYVLSAGTLTLSGGSEYVGNSGNGTFTQSGGNNSMSFLELGYGGNSTGNYLLSGNGSLTATANEYVGISGNSTFTQSGGSNWTRGFQLGYSPGTTGNYILSAGNFTAIAYEGVGTYGSGTFAQTGGNNSTGMLILGDGGNSVGSFTLSAGTLTVGGNESIGVSGNGTFIQSGGNNTATGVLAVGGNSSYTLSAGTLSAGSLSLITGSAFNWNGGTFTTGAVTQTGGNFTTPGMLVIAASGGNVTSYNFAGGMLNIGNLSGSGLTWTGGTLNFTNATLTVSNSGQLGGNLTVGNGQALEVSNPSDSLIVDGGTLNLGGNGSVTVSGNETIGLTANSTLTQTGGSHLVNNSLTIGGNGRLSLQGGTLAAAAVNVNSGGTFLQSSNAIALISALNLKGGTLQLRSDSDATMGTGETDVYGSATIDVDSITAGNPSRTLSLGTLQTWSTYTAPQLNVTGSVNAGNRYTLSFTSATLNSPTTFNPTTADLTIGAINGAGNTIYKDGEGALTLTGDVEYATIILDAGTLNANAAGALGRSLTQKGGVTNINATNALTGSAFLEDDAGVVNVNAANNYTGETYMPYSGTLNANATGALGSGPVYDFGSSTLNANAAGSLGTGEVEVGGTFHATTADTLTGTNQLVVDNGQAFLNYPNDYTGGTGITSGGLTVTVPGALGSGTIRISEQATLFLRSDASASFTSADTEIYDAVGIDVDSLTAGNPSQTISLGTLGTNYDQFGGEGATPADPLLTVVGSVNAGHRYTVAFGNTTLGDDTTFNPTSADLSLGPVSEDSNLQDNAFQLIKTGLGNLTLNGASSYFGSTQISAGRLVLAGSLGNTSVTVAHAATFSVQPLNSSTTLAGRLTLNGGSSFDMVDGGLGTFDITGSGTNLTIGGTGGGGAFLTFEIGNAAAGTDQIVSSGQVDIRGAGGQITITPLAGDTSLTPGNYTLITGGSAFSFASGSVLALASPTITVGNTTYALSLSHPASNTEVLTISGSSYDPSQDFILAQNGNESFSVGASQSLSGYRNEYIGYNYTGTFTQTGGTNSASGEIILGVNAGSTGNYTLGPAGSLAEDSMIVAQQGSGIFTQTGGTHSITNSLTVNNQGTYNLNGGTLSAGTVTVNSGGRFYQDGGNATLIAPFFTLNGGTHTVSGNLYIDPGAIGSYTLSSGTLQGASVEFVGYNGTGTLTQTGGSNSAGTAYLGYNSGSNGSVSISGNATFTTVQDLIVGESGTGLLTQSGGNVTVGGTYDGTTEWVGLNNGAVGTVNLSGNATHNVENLVVGNAAGSSGSYTLSDNAALHVFNVPGFSTTGSENIGYSGTGNFTQNAGTTHTVDGSLAVGGEPGGVGAYQMNGGNLSTGGSELIGFSGNGTFAQTGGNNTTAQVVDLGHYAGGSGTFNLSGGNLTAGALYDGQYGKAVFNQSGGTLNLSVVSYVYSDDAAGAAFNQSGGTVNLGIVLNVGQWAGSPTFAGTGSGTVNQTGGNFNINGEQVHIETLGTFNLSGTGTLTSTGFDSGLLVGGTFHQSDATSTANFSGGFGVGIGNGTAGSAGGTVIVDNGNMTFASTSTATIGSLGGNGTFIQNGGNVTFAGSLNIAVGAGSSGTYNLNGGTLNVGGNIVNNGTMTQNPAAILNLAGTFTGNGIIQSNGNATIANGTQINGGTLQVSGHLTGSGAVAIGASGNTGNFTQSGGSVSLGVLGVGNDATETGGNGTGVASISGGSLYAGTILLGDPNGGSGSMTLSGNAAVTVGGGVSTNDLTMNGGSLAVLDQDPPAGEDPVLNRSIVGGYMHNGAMYMNAGNVTTPYLKVGIDHQGTYIQTGGNTTVTLGLIANAGNNSIVQLTGGTLSTAGTQVSHGAIFTVGGGGTLATLNLLGGNHSIADGLTLGSNSQLTGSGNITGGVTIGSGATIAPGADAAHVGVLNADTQSWSAGGNFIWKTTAATGTPGSDWDLLTMSALTVGATHVNPFTVNVTSAGNNTAGGPAAGFNPAQPTTWTIAQIGSAAIVNGNATPTGNGTITPLTGTGSDVFALDTSNFVLANPGTFPDGFQLELVGTGSGDDLDLVYDATPEPTGGLLALCGAIPVLLPRRRRNES